MFESLNSARVEIIDNLTVQLSFTTTLLKGFVSHVPQRDVERINFLVERIDRLISHLAIQDYASFQEEFERIPVPKFQISTSEHVTALQKDLLQAGWERAISSAQLLRKAVERLN